jgi:hypothetical protein
MQFLFNSESPDYRIKLLLSAKGNRISFKMTDQGDWMEVEEEDVLVANTLHQLLCYVQK